MAHIQTREQLISRASKLCGTQIDLPQALRRRVGGRQPTSRPCLCPGAPKTRACSGATFLAARAWKQAAGVKLRRRLCLCSSLSSYLKLGRGHFKCGRGGPACSSVAAPRGDVARLNGCVFGLLDHASLLAPLPSRGTSKQVRPKKLEGTIAVGPQPLHQVPKEGAARPRPGLVSAG